MKNKWVIDKWENPKISPLMILLKAYKSKALKK